MSTIQSIQCSICGNDNNPSFVLCWKCGKSLPDHDYKEPKKICPDCKSEVAEGAMKCKCGSALGVDRALGNISNSADQIAKVALLIGLIVLSPFWFPKVMALVAVLLF